MEIEVFFHSLTSALTYSVFDPATRDADVIDFVLDYEATASVTWTESIDEEVARPRISPGVRASPETTSPRAAARNASANAFGVS